MNNMTTTTVTCSNTTTVTRSNTTTVTRSNTTTVTCSNCLRNYENIKDLIDHDKKCKKIKYNKSRLVPIVSFAQKNFYRIY